MIKDMRFAIKYSLPVNLLFLCAVFVVGVGAVRMTRATLALRAEVRDAEARLEAIAARKDQIARRLAEQDAPEAVEYEAKAKMNLKNAGEEVVVVAPEEKPADSAESSGVWQRIMDFLRAIVANRLFGA